MANQNFVVHNGLTVGALTIDAATSNVSLPVAKQIAIGNVILRDNGDGKLHIRDITDNSDAELIGTVGAISTTSGNIQIGTNHIESTNPNGPISLRPNGNGNIAFSSNTIMIGHGGAFTLVGTGIQTDPIYGINYPATNIVVTLSAIDSSGNLRLGMTTPSTSGITGALQVMGGIGALGNLNIGAVGAVSGQFHTIRGNITQTSTGGAVYFNTTGNISASVANVGILNSTGNVLAAVGTFSALTVNGNIGVTGAWINAGTVNVTGNVLASAVTMSALVASGSTGSAGQVLQSTGTGVQWAAADQILGGASNVRVTANYVNVSVQGSNVFSVGQNTTLVSGNLTVGGNLFVLGNTTTFNTNNLSISDSLIYLATTNPSDALDIGFVGHFINPGYQHTGFVRDASDGVWKLFANVVPEPTTTIDFTNANYSSLYVGNIQTVAWANIGSGLNVGGNILAKIGTFNELDLNGYLNSTGNVLATGGIFNALTVNGGITSTGFFNTTANISGAVVLGGTMTTTGTLTAAQVNSTGNVLAQGAVFNSQRVNGTSTVNILNSTGNILGTGGILNTLTVNGTTNTQGVVPLATNTYSVGSTTLWYSAFWGAAVNARYADLAEKYLADAEYEPGTVLMFGGSAEVTLADEGTRRVAGVVSTNPAYLMNHQIEGDNIVDVALVGRVPVKVTGYIQKGDMMVSAGNGRARASAMPQIGTVIGKALQDFDGSEGVIEVVIGRL